MKKLLVLTLAVMFVLGFSVLTMGAVKITGEVQTEYSFTDAEQDSSLELDFEAPISSTVTAYASLDIDWATAFLDEDGDIDGEIDADEIESETGFDLDEAYFKVKTGFGNFFVGLREMSLYTNEVLDEGDSCWGDVMGAGVVTWEYASSAGFFVNASYSRYVSGDFGYADYAFLEGGYMIGVGYEGANWMLAYYHVNPTPDSNDPGYALLFEIEPADWLKLYATFAVLTADADSDADCGVIGAQLTFGKFEFKVDVDTVDDVGTMLDGDGDPVTEDGFNPYGWKIEYELNNKVSFEYVQGELTQGDFFQEVEVKVEF